MNKFEVGDKVNLTIEIGVATLRRKGIIIGKRKDKFDIKNYRYEVKTDDNYIYDCYHYEVELVKKKMNKLDKIKEELGNAQIHLEFCKDALNNYKGEEDIVFVPKSINLNGRNGTEHAILINNDNGQSLYKLTENKSYSVNSGFWNDNNGKNYKLVEVDKPVANKLYFVTDKESFNSINILTNYKIYLNEKYHCSWENNNEHYQVDVYGFNWKHTYEVVRVDGRGEDE